MAETKKVLPRDVASQDLARLIEGRYDAAGCWRLIGLLELGDPLQVVCADALRLTGHRLVAAGESLRAAVLHNSAELVETSAASLAVDAARAQLAARYKHLRGQLESSYLNPDPDEGVSAAELAQRQQIFDRAFTQTPYYFGRLAYDGLAETSGLVLSQLKLLSGHVDADAIARYTARHQAFVQAQQVWAAERKEDLDATAALDVQRAEFDRQSRGHALFVTATLWQIGRAADAGQFLKLREPGYLKRREVDAPILEEPDADDGLEPLPQA